MITGYHAKEARKADCTILDEMHATHYNSEAFLI